MRTLCQLLLFAVGAAACVGNISGGGEGAGPGMPPSKPTTPPANPNNPAPSDPNNPAPTNPTDPNPIAPAACAPGRARIWPLTPQQYVRTVRSLLPAAADNAAALEATVNFQTGFSNEASRLVMNESFVGELLEGVWETAGAATADLATLSPCLAQPAPGDACVRDFIKGFGTRAFRREITDVEISELAAFVKKEADLKTGLRRFFLYLLTSPSFAYRTELGAPGASGKIQLTDFERAQTLSYFLTDGPPDAELFAAAKAGALAQAGQIEAQTRRLLGNPQSGAGYAKLFFELFDTKAARSTDKDGEVFPAWTEALRADLARESESFVEQVLWREDAKLSTLLTGSFTMLNGPLASFYGLPAPTGTGFAKVTHKPGQRAGIMTQAGIMAVLAKNNDTDAVARGHFVRQVLLCTKVPPPPDNLNPTQPEADGKRTTRERLAQHSSDGTCAGCHRMMDPLGLAFEIYDGIGRHRTVDAAAGGKTIDATGVLEDAQPAGARFSDAVELMKVLSTSPTAQRCFVETTFRYAHGREVEKADRCAIDRLMGRFDAQGGNLIDLAVAITTDDEFFVRQAP